jgi:DNA-binding CsgD family transcriptional regulator
MPSKPKTLTELQKLIPRSAGLLHPIPGVINMVASEDGRLWSVARGKPIHILERGLTQRYARVKRDDVGFTYTPIATLIALTFLGEPPSDKSSVLFHDGDFTNCHPNNLYYGTKEAHTEQMTQYQRRGEEHGMSKLTDMDIEAIRYLFSKDYSPQDIAKRFGITDKNVLAIVKRKTWRHVP